MWVSDKLRTAARQRDGTWRWFEEDEKTGRMVPITEPPECRRITLKDTYPGWAKLLIWIGGGALCWVPFIAAFYAIRACL